MTFATLTTALGQGYSISKIIKSILAMNTPLAKSIKEALKQGYNEDEIGEYLEKGKSASYSQKNKMLRGRTEEEKARGIAYREPKTQKNIKSILESAAMAAPAAAAGYAAGPAIGAALGSAGSALGRAAPQIFGRGAIPGAAQTAAQTGINPAAHPGPTSPSVHVMPSPAMTQAPQMQNQSNLQQTLQPPGLSNVTSVTQPQQVTQPEGIINPREYLEKLGIKDKVDDLLKLGNSPEQTAAVLGMKGGAGKVRGEIDPELLANIDAYAKEPKDEQKLPHGVPEKIEDDKLGFKAAFKTMGGGALSDNLYKGIFDALKEGKDTFAGVKDNLLQAAKPAFDAGQIKSVEDLKKFADFYEKSKEQKAITKNETVATPHGVGEVKEIRNGKAIVEVDGKKHQVDEDELEASPIPEKDLAALYDDLIKGIESETGEDVSRMVQWAGYNPETNTLQFLPHTGKLYKYGNISSEDAALLTDILSTRKTSGENFIGAWKAGSKSPIGAALSKLIRKLQTERGGKGNEYEETHEPIYSAYEPAVQAKKKKKKK
jgi:hypothetical protein